MEDNAQWDKEKQEGRSGTRRTTLNETLRTKLSGTG